MTIPQLITIWHRGDAERGAVAVQVEHTITLWYAHKARMPQPDSLARSSPRVLAPVEQWGWHYVEENVSEPLRHALDGALAAEDRHPVTEALAWKALDHLAELIREGHGFVPPRFIEPKCEAERIEDDANLANAKVDAKYGTDHGTADRKPLGKGEAAKGEESSIRTRFARLYGKAR